MASLNKLFDLSLTNLIHSICHLIIWHLHSYWLFKREKHNSLLLSHILHQIQEYILLTLTLKYVRYWTHSLYCKKSSLLLYCIIAFWLVCWFVSLRTFSEIDFIHSKIYQILMYNDLNNIFVAWIHHISSLEHFHLSFHFSVPN